MPKIRSLDVMKDELFKTALRKHQIFLTRIRRQILSSEFRVLYDMTYMRYNNKNQMIYTIAIK
jgi:hypothetical protein